MKKGRILLALLLAASTIFCGCASSSASTTASKGDDVTEIQEEEVAQSAAIETPAPEEVEYTFYLLRHGETIFNVTGEVGGGWVDSPLTEHGRAVAETLTEGLKDVEFTGVYTSISERAWDTTNYAIAGRGIVPVINEDLKELNFGTFEGTTGEEKDKCWENYGYRLEHGWVDEGGESFDIVADRMQKAIDLAMKEHPEGGNILLGSHGITILSYVQKYMGDSPLFIEYYDGGKNYTIPNCSITKVHYKNGEYTLESIADTQYINEDVDK